MIDGKVVGCPHHILEPARTNLVTYSEDFSNATWTKSNNPTITTNIAIAPDGTLSADGIQDEDGANLKAIYESASVNSNSTITSSVFVKKESTKVNFGGLMLFFSGGTVKYAYGIIDEVKGTIVIAPESNIVSSSAKVEDYGTYWRFTLTGTDNGGNTSARFQYYASFSTNGTNVSGNSIGSVRTIWGAMLEAGSYPTSYIPTNGSTVTRSAETANGSGDAATFNDSEGVLMIESSLLDVSQDGNRISISDGSSAENRITFRYLNDNEIQIELGLTNGFSEILNVGSSVNFNKIAVVYNSTNASVFINGVKLITNSMSSLSNLSQLQFNRFNANTENFEGNTKQIQYYNSALTDSELEQLTSWTSFSDMAEGQLYTIE